MNLGTFRVRDHVNLHPGPDRGTFDSKRSELAVGQAPIRPCFDRTLSRVCSMYLSLEMRASFRLPITSMDRQRFSATETAGVQSETHPYPPWVAFLMQQELPCANPRRLAEDYAGLCRSSDPRSTRSLPQIDSIARKFPPTLVLPDTNRLEHSLR